MNAGHVIISLGQEIGLVILVKMGIHMSFISLLFQIMRKFLLSITNSQILKTTDFKANCVIGSFLWKNYIHKILF